MRGATHKSGTFAYCIAVQSPLSLTTLPYNFNMAALEGNIYEYPGNVTSKVWKYVYFGFYNVTEGPDTKENTWNTYEQTYLIIIND